ncbi:TIGR02530 family flagellar biosynthesis protein [Litchfieldia alkalitelluris]|uniref:TIGR02530 family flagellar biosynthesis protein n=1 Tax=Litchfieldia alkalitelluris TaxID=304268 RepID=UPI00099887CF|nr:TIGR02530 family flagellar biosynthesis protein [Litchfieldia alkalitelluris]
MNNRISTYQAHQLAQLAQHKQRNQVKQANTESFQGILNDAVNSSLKISKHAQQRLDERKISLNQSEWNKINELVQVAKDKGINESLVLTTNAALIVNAKNSTVITAMGRNEAKSQIFTNINGTIVID